jgi:hypothetical protein
MKKEHKLLTLFIFTIIATTFVINFVSADPPAASSENVLSTITKNINFLNIDFNADYIPKPLTTKILLFLLVTIIVFGIAESIPFLENRGGVSFIFSVIIGILAVFYLNSQEIYTILNSYQAFGIAVTSIIPFIVIAVIAKRLSEKGYKYTLLSKFLWIIFFVTLLLKFLFSDMEKLGQFGLWTYLLVLLATIIMILWEKKIFHRIYRLSTSGTNERIKENSSAKIEAKLLDLATQITTPGLSNKAKENLIAQYDSLVDTAKSMGYKQFKKWSHK